MPDSAPPNLSHIAPDGSARMVDVGEKPVTARLARAEGFVHVSPALATRIRENSLAKGDLLATARLAGIMAAKRTADLIPLCHPLPLEHVAVTLELEPAGSAASAPPGRVRITAEVATHARTGVEMEALTAVSAAALTVVDMGKAVDKAMTISGIRVLEKRGGRSGVYKADA